MQKKTTFVSIIIPVYNDSIRLNTLLCSLSKQSYPSELFEIIIIDNDSTPPIRLHSKQSNIYVLTELRPGSYVARNRGIQQAKGQLLVFTDSDCLPQPQWLETLVTQHQQQPHTILAGKIEVIATTPLSTLACYDIACAFPQPLFIQRYHFAATANLAVPYSVLKQVGLFNTQLLSGGDSEWGLRATKAGFNLLYIEQAVVQHPAREQLLTQLIKVKRLVGGAYANKNHIFEQKKFSFLGLLRGLLPPRSDLKLIWEQPQLSWLQKIKAASAAFILKYSQAYYRFYFTFKTKKDFERR